MYTIKWVERLIVRCKSRNSTLSNDSMYIKAKNINEKMKNGKCMIVTFFLDEKHRNTMIDLLTQKVELNTT